MKIVSIKKFIRSIFLVLAIIAVLSLLLSKATLSHKETTYRTICIETGDTLWNIAKDLQKDNYYKNKDIRFIINDLIKINNLNSKILYENQKINVPVI